MTIEKVGLVTLTTTTQTGWTCAIPGDVQDGDVLFAFVSKGSAGAVTTPAGKTYTLLDPADGNTSIFLWCYAHVLAAADAGTNHTWSWASVRSGAAAFILRGAESALDVADPPAPATATATGIACPASTVNTAGAWVLWLPCTTASVTCTFPATVNGNTVTRELGAVGGALGLGWAPYGATGATATCAVTFSASNRCLGKTLVVAPAPDAPAGAVPQRWTGSAWTAATVKRWDGGAWVTATVKRWTGTEWV